MSPKPDQNPRVLFVEDEPAIISVMVRYLEASGYEIAAVANVDAALGSFAENKPDIIVTDIFLGGSDGFTLIETIRAGDPDLPIIAMSGVLLNDSQHTALEFLPKLPSLAGVVCLQKPFRPPELLKAIDAAFALSAYADE